jgi:hypothetical protein
LKIGNEEFSDLDEIHAVFVEPMARYVKDLMNFPKFTRGTKLDLETHVDREMMANPKRIPYILGFSDVPGKFLLIYKTSSKDRTHSDSVIVTHDGFKYRNMIYKDIPHVIQAFKSQISSGASNAGSKPQQPQPVPQVYRGPVPQMAPQSMRPGMGMAPYRYPAPQQPFYGAPQPMVYNQGPIPQMRPGMNAPRPMGQYPPPNMGYGMRPPMGQPPRPLYRPAPYAQQPPHAYQQRR